jgi:hypothetical protein
VLADAYDLGSILSDGLHMLALFPIIFRVE